jgi:DNA polymerase
VFGKGVLPCEVLFVGEAPGESEDVLGRPFCGPAGHLLDYMVKQALPDGVRCAYTNLVCCIPRTEAGGKAGEPPDEAIRQCQPRLAELLVMAKPKVVVCVGKLSGDFVEEDTASAYRYALRLPDTIKRVVVLHPAAILRANPAHKGLLQQKWIVQVRNAYYDKVEEVEDGSGS